MTHQNMTLVEALKRLNVVTAAGLSAFTVLTLIQSGLMGGVISFIEANPILPTVLSLVILIGLLLSGNTRSPSYYHPAEVGMVVFTVIFLIAFSYMVEVQNLVLNNYPYGGIAMCVVLLIGGVVVGR